MRNNSAPKLWIDTPQSGDHIGAWSTEQIERMNQEFTAAVKQAFVARVIIEQAQAGERDPERLCEAALKALRPSRQGAVTDPNPPPPHASLPHTPGSSS
jgi:hypothetical protein